MAITLNMAAQAVALRELSEQLRMNAKVRGVPTQEQNLELYKSLEEVAYKIDHIAEILERARDAVGNSHISIG